MQKDTGTLNQRWAALMISELVQHGTCLFCLSSGSQNSPFVIAAAEHPQAKTFVHFDERGMSFHGLGYAKASKQPVVLIVTSGTAVANLLPAVMEAHHDQIPLIIITADRPPELRDNGENQATDQVKIFENFVRWQVDMPCPDSKISESYIGTTIAQAIAYATSAPAGPVHLNCMVRKPFFPKVNLPCAPFQSAAHTSFTVGKNILQADDYVEIANQLSKHKKGIILVSGTTPLHSLESLYALARQLQWPIFPDVLSNARSAGAGYGVIPYYDLIIKTLGGNEDFIPDAILQIGDRFVSQKLTDWLASKKPKVHCHISPHIHRKDSAHSMTHRIACDCNFFVENFHQYLPGRTPSSWFQTWRELNAQTSTSLATFFQKHQELSEPLLFYHLASVSSEDTGLFLSNSMPIRHADSFYCPETPVGPIHCNRGVSGIDGNIASACGVARALNKPVLAILGDLAFLHDINSLAQLRAVSLKVLVINNDGGSIFSFLPIAEKKELFTPFFTTPHGMDFKHAAPLFGLNYENPKTLGEMHTALDSPASNLIEIQMPSTQNLQISKKILKHLKKSQTLLKV